MAGFKITQPVKTSAGDDRDVVTLATNNDEADPGDMAVAHALIDKNLDLVNPAADETVKTVGTRRYGAGQRIAIDTVSDLTAGLTAVEVLLHSRGGRSYVVTGDTPTATIETGIPIEDGEKFHLRLVSGQEVAVIGESTGGHLHVIPVIPS